MEEHENAKKKLWIAKAENVDQNELKDARKALMNSYHSYVQTHVGYIIAIMLGFFALITSLDTFLTIPYGTILLLLLIAALVYVGIYMVLRIVYWTTYANLAIVPTYSKVIYFFNKHNSTAEHPFFEKAPCTAILQIAIRQAFEDFKEKYSFLRRLSLTTA